MPVSGDWGTAENQRRSAMRRLVTVHPVPDGTIDKSDRPHVLWHYMGIEFTAPTGGVTVSPRVEDERLVRPAKLK